jgi:dTDP-4-dehydrorhamnose 3,5-epimerase
VPQGFAHGFLVLSDTAEFLYKCSDYYAPTAERGIVWNDPALGIAWPVEGRELQLNARDQGYPRLADAPASQLPVYAQ